MMAAAHKSNAPSLCVIDIVTSDKDAKFAPYQDMANAIIAHAERHGKCDLEDLLSTGQFSRGELLDRWHMAYEMARIELRLNRSAGSVISTCMTTIRKVLNFTGNH